MSDERQEVDQSTVEGAQTQAQAQEESPTAPTTDAEQLASPVALKDYSGELPNPSLSMGTDQLVESWFDEHIRGSIIGTSTQMWNHLMVAKEHLKAMLRR